jgi:hypothetical protein
MKERWVKNRLRAFGRQRKIRTRQSTPLKAEKQKQNEGPSQPSVFCQGTFTAGIGPVGAARSEETLTPMLRAPSRQQLRLRVRRAFSNDIIDSQE